MQIISSKENVLIKHICKLKEKKYRNEYQEFLIEGAKIVKEAIDEKAKIKQIIINEEALSSELIKKYLEKDLKDLNYVTVTNNIFKLLTNVDNPQGVMAIIEKNSKETKIDFSQDIILALDDIQDPGNLGTIIRTADSVGLNQIIVSKGTADAYNPKVIRSTMGAIFRVKIIECDNLKDTLKIAKENDFKILVTALDTNKFIYDLKLKNNVIVIGNEANGVEKEIQEISDIKAKIPIIGKTESLNASVATGVVLYEYVRQKLSIE